MPNSPDAPLVYVVDDEEPVRRAFSLLLRSAGIPCRAFESAEQFLAGLDPQRPGCLLLDITMPRLTGPQLQELMGRKGIDLPIIAISARDDESSSRAARGLGARFLFRKPVDDQALLDAINWVLKADGFDTAGEPGPLPRADS